MSAVDALVVALATHWRTSVSGGTVTVRTVAGWTFTVAHAANDGWRIYGQPPGQHARPVPLGFAVDAQHVHDRIARHLHPQHTAA